MKNALPMTPALRTLLKMTFPNYRGRKYRLELATSVTFYDRDYSGGTHADYIVHARGALGSERAASAASAGCSNCRLNASLGLLFPQCSLRRCVLAASPASSIARPSSPRWQRPTLRVRKLGLFAASSAPSAWPAAAL